MEFLTLIKGILSHYKGFCDILEWILPHDKEITGKLEAESVVYNKFGVFTAYKEWRISGIKKAA